MKRKLVRMAVAVAVVVALLACGAVLATTLHKLPTQYIWQGQVEIEDDPDISVIACQLIFLAEDITLVTGVNLTLKNTADEDINCHVVVQCEDNDYKWTDYEWTVRANSDKKAFVMFWPIPLEELHTIHFLITRV